MATKFLLLLAAVLLSAPAAMAEVHTPQAYDQLTNVPLAPGKAPRLVNGVSDLSVRENRHREHLPMQLEGAMTKIKKAKYAPKRQKSEKKSVVRSAKAVKKAPQKVKVVNVDQQKGFQENLPMPTARDNPASF